MPPKAGLNRETVLAAAVELVDREGPEGLTVVRLSTQLQIRPPSLYNHIHGLEQLKRDLGVRGLRQMASRFRTAATGVAGSDALKAIADAYRRFAQEHPGLYALTLRPQEEDADYTAAAQEVVAVVLAVLQGYDLSDKEALHATRCLRSAIHGFVSLEAAGGFGLPLDLNESFSRLIWILDQGLRNRDR